MNYVKTIITHLIDRADRYVYIKDTSTKEINLAKQALEKINAIPFPKKFEFDGDIKIGKYGEEAKKNDYARIIFDWSLEKLADLGRHKKATIEVCSGDSFVKLEFVADKKLK